MEALRKKNRVRISEEKSITHASTHEGAAAQREENPGRKAEGQWAQAPSKASGTQGKEPHRRQEESPRERMLPRTHTLIPKSW